MTITTRSAQNDSVSTPMAAGKLILAATMALVTSQLNRRKVRKLADMPDYILQDLGIRRDDVHQALQCHWRDDASYKLASAALRRRRGFKD